MNRIQKLCWTGGTLIVIVLLLRLVLGCSVETDPHGSRAEESIDDSVASFRSMTVEECREGCQAWEVSGTNQCNATSDQCVAACTVGTTAQKNACKQSCTLTRKACREGWDTYRKECRGQCVPMVCDAPAPPPGTPFLAACLFWETAWSDAGERVDPSPTCSDACTALNRSASNDCQNDSGLAFGLVWSDAYQCSAPDLAHPWNTSTINPEDPIFPADDHGTYQCCCD